MKKFHGKVLLLLGTNVGSVDIVNYARINGAYVIVADNLPPEESKAKTVADEHVLVSTGDLDGLKRIVRDKGVTSVFAGVSEFNLLRALDLCEYFGFPFYCNRQQWNQIEHKDNFRSLCRRYGVPCPETYFTGSHLTEEALADVEYPVIVKPVDCGSSIGVSICRTRDEVLAASEGANTNTNGGILYEYGNEYIIKGIVNTVNADELGDIVVKSEAGKTVRMSDIAEVKVGGESPLLGMASVNGEPAVLLTISKQYNTGTIDLIHNIEASLADMQKNM